MPSNSPVVGTRTNRHATVVVAGAHGVLIGGPSGSGKTRLALRLVEACSARGQFAALVCDDQAWLLNRNGRLVARAPAPIAGLVEIRGYGPADADHEPAAVVDLVVQLVPPSDAPRLSGQAVEDMRGVALPRLDLAAGDARGGALAVLAWLDARHA
jgi:serine kinase of HPr protein (carbohydrate metabolism regulator)